MQFNAQIHLGWQKPYKESHRFLVLSDKVALESYCHLQYFFHLLRKKMLAMDVIGVYV